MPNRSVLQASVISDMQTKQQSVYVLTADNAESLVADKLEARMADRHEHTCGDCGVRITACVSAGVQPFCPNCGSDDVSASAQKLTASAAAISPNSLAGVQCSSCHSVNVVESTFLKASANHLHCVMCGTHIKASVDEAAETPAEEAAETPAEQSAEDAAGTEVQAAETPAEPMVAADDVSVAPLQGADDGAAADMAPVEPPPEAGELELAAPEPKEEVAAATAPEMEATDPVDVQASESPEMELAASPEVVPEEAEEVTASEFPEDEGTTMVASLLGVDDSVAGVSFHMASGRMVVSKNTASIYSLAAKDAGENAALVGTPVLAQAVINHARKVGLSAAMKDFGFRPLRVKAFSRSDLDAAVSKTAEQHKALKASADAVQEECFAMSAVGVARGTYKGFASPLRAAMIEQLMLAGMDAASADRTATRVLASAGAEHNKQILRLAARFSAMSPAMRTEHRDNILDMVASESAPAEQPASVSSLTARLSTPAVPAAVASRTAVTASSSSRVSSILAGSQGLNFN